MANSNALKTEYCCSICGKPLTDENSRENAYTCLDCENKRFKQLEEANGTSIALFLMCGMVNLPLEPLILPYKFAEKESNKWEVYCNLLKEKGKLEKNGKLRGFINGVCDIREIFGSKMSYTDFSAYVQAQQELIDEQEGTEEQRERWGIEDGYTTEDYNALDRMLGNRLAGFKGQTITDQMEYIMEEVAKWSLVADKLRRKGDIKGATDALKAIDTLLASECLRKKDEKPLENFRPDAWIDAFEKSGLMQDGDFLPLEELENKLIEVMKGKGYEQTLDAVYQLEMNIINNARRNEDLPTIFELPAEMQIQDELGEFALEESEEEKDAKNYAKLTKVRVEKKPKGKKK